MITKLIYKYTTLVLFTFTLISFISCESEQRAEEVVGEIPEVMSFSDHIQPIFNGTSINIELTGNGRACIDCHNGGTPPNLTSGNSYIELVSAGYIDIDNPESSKVYDIIAYGSMNKYTNVTDIAYILEWISQGAEDN